MYYSVSNNVAIINGNNGAYDNKVKDSSVKYGRNAVSNFTSYVDEFAKAAPLQPAADFKKLLNHDKTKFDVTDSTFNNAMDSFDKTDAEIKAYNKSTPPVNFEYQYMQKPVTPDKIDKLALMGAAFEEMGKKISMPVETMTKKLQAVFGEKVTAKAFDVNGDNQIDVGEYSTSLLLEDMMSKDSKLDLKNITGSVNNKGQDSLAPYIDNKNTANASSEISLLYKNLELGKAKNLFELNKNNIV